MSYVAPKEGPGGHDVVLPRRPLSLWGAAFALPFLYLPEVGPFLVKEFLDLQVGAVGDVGCNLLPESFLVDWVDPHTVLLIIETGLLLD